MTKEDKIKDLEERIKQLEQRPVYIPYPYPIQNIPEPTYPCTPPMWHPNWYGTTSGGSNGK